MHIIYKFNRCITFNTHSNQHKKSTGTKPVDFVLKIFFGSSLSQKSCRSSFCFKYSMTLFAKQERLIIHAFQITVNTSLTGYTKRMRQTISYTFTKTICAIFIKQLPNANSTVLVSRNSYSPFSSFINYNHRCANHNHH